MPSVSHAGYLVLFVCVFFVQGTTPNLVRPLIAQCRNEVEIPSLAVSDTVQNPVSVLVADFDNDGDLDAASSSVGDNVIAWFENTFGNGSSWTKHVVDSTCLYPIQIVAVDVDSDSDIDLVSVSRDDSSVSWYANSDGLGSFGARIIVSNVATAVTSVSGADLDGDTFVDILIGSYVGVVVWYRNMDGLGSFDSGTILSNTTEVIRSIIAVDLDQDGRKEVLTSSDLSIMLFSYDTDSGGFISRSLAPSDGFGAYVASADFDGDFDEDLLFGSKEGALVWYSNRGLLTFVPGAVISRKATIVASVQTVDIDSDLDLDVFSAALDDDRVSWYENADGQGNFGPEQILSSSEDGGLSVAIGDVTGNGVPDVVVGLYYLNRIVIYNYIAPFPKYKESTVESNLDGARALHMADIDGDGSVDIAAVVSLRHLCCGIETRMGMVSFLSLLLCLPRCMACQV